MLPIRKRCHVWAATNDGDDEEQGEGEHGAFVSPSHVSSGSFGWLGLTSARPITAPRAPLPDRELQRARGGWRDEVVWRDTFSQRPLFSLKVSDARALQVSCFDSCTTCVLQQCANALPRRTISPTPHRIARPPPRRRSARTRTDATAQPPSRSRPRGTSDQRRVAQARDNLFRGQTQSHHHATVPANFLPMPFRNRKGCAALAPQHNSFMPARRAEFSIAVLLPSTTSALCFDNSLAHRPR